MSDVVSLLPLVFVFVVFYAFYTYLNEDEIKNTKNS